MGIFANRRYQDVVIHDLRTPLNVIGLAMRMIDDLGASNPGVSEDLALIRSHTAELERMITTLVEYSRLPENPHSLAIEDFDPKRMLATIVDEYRDRSKATITLDQDKGPSEVFLDEAFSRLALRKVLANTMSASGKQPIHVRVQDRADRWLIEMTVKSDSKHCGPSQTISPDQFERILGTSTERRGLDLAIAARVSTLFGGLCRLEVVPGQSTSVILDWPTKLK